MRARRVLLVTGGTWHDFPGQAARIADALAPVARCEVTEDLGRLSRRGLAGYDALALYTCLAAADSGLEDKARAAVPEHARRAVEDFVSGGGALLPLHGALCSFDGWTDLGRLMGGRWVWGRTGHDPVGPFAVRVRRGHPLWRGLDDFEVTDELYHRLALTRPVDVLLEAEWRGEMQPLGWTCRFGRGRVFVNALGHTPESLAHPAVRALLARGLAWALGAGAAPINGSAAVPRSDG